MSLGDQPPNGAERLAAELDLGSGDETLGDRDQTLSDADQTASDRDQMASEEDELSSARDQETADREQAAADAVGSAQDPAAHARNRAARAATAHDRDVMSRLRQETALERGRAARTRDATARARDRAADLRDRIAEARDQEMREQDGWSDSLLRESANVAVLRKQAARDRARAATDREDAARDRERSARVREEFARYRREAARERAEAARALEQAVTDPLTRARASRAGLADLQREIDRARHTTGSLVLAFVGVDDLKQVNDTEGHLAGNRLLADAASALRDGLRSYDLIIRFGDDEFLCALSGIATDEVELRFQEIAEQLAADSNGHSISAGFAELQDGDDTQALIARADNALLQARQARPTQRPAGAEKSG